MDGDLDIFSGERNVEVIINDGNAGFTNLAKPPSGFASWAALGDIDGDGDLDAYLTGIGQLLLNDGTGVFTGTGQEFPSGSELVALAELDQQTGVDVVVTGNNAVKLLTNDGSGMLTEITSASISSVPRLDMAIGDLDRDGDIDFFSAGGSKIAFFANDGEGLFSKVQENPIPGFGSSALADLDGDGDLDAFVALWRQGNQVWLNETVVVPGVATLVSPLESEH